MTRALLFLTLKIFLLAQCLQAFVPSTTFQPSRATTKALFYSNDRVGRDVARSKPHVKKIETEKTIMGKKPTITKLHSLDELKYFLEEDDRLVAIK